MLKLKSFLLTFSALFLLACGNAAVTSPNPSEQELERDQTEQVDDQQEQDDELEKDGEDDEEDDKAQAPSDQSSAQVSQENQVLAAKDEANSSAQSAADLTNQDIIDRLLKAVPTLSRESQFLVDQVDDQFYQIEVRQDSPDPALSNLDGIYRYDWAKDQFYFQDITSGEFQAL